MTFAGIDFKTGAIDIAILELDSYAAAWHRIPLKGVDAWERTRSIRDLLPTRGRWTDAGIVTVAIEEPMSRMFKSAVALARVQGAILSTLPADMPVLPLKPHEWKKAVGLAGNAGKDDVDQLVIRRYPPTADWSQDGRDAYAIAWVARELSQKAADRQNQRLSLLTEEVTAA